MTLVAWILKASLLVTDARGHHALKAIPEDGAKAIAATCATTAAPASCAAVYLVQAFRESGYNLHAPGDCRDHITGKLYMPDAQGHCRPGDGEPLSFGPFQTRRAPATWEQAVKDFTPLLTKSAIECKEPLAMVASGSCTNRAGIEISRARMKLAHEIVDALPFKPEET